MDNQTLGGIVRDYWNDPPENPEPPQCPNTVAENKSRCEGSGEYLYDGKTGMVFSCDTCGYQWVLPFPVDPEPEPEIEIPDDEPEPRPCPHGKLDQCDACDYLGDIAYDTDRERRYFGR